MKSLKNLIKSIIHFFKNDDPLSFNGFICAVILFTFGIPISLYFIICGIEGHLVELNHPDFNQWVSLFGSIASFAGSSIIGLLVVYQNVMFHKETQKLQKQLSNIEFQKTIPQFGFSFGIYNYLNEKNSLILKIHNVGNYAILNINIFNIECTSICSFSIPKKYINVIGSSSQADISLDFLNPQYQSHPFGGVINVKFEIICSDTFNKDHKYGIQLIGNQRGNSFDIESCIMKNISQAEI